MAPETFEVTLTDAQLEAAKAASLARGVNLGPVGSLHRDGVTVNYKVETPQADSNVVTVDVLYRPFYVPADTIQSLITDFLTNPPAADPPAGESKPASEAGESTTPPETTVATNVVEHRRRRSE